MLKAERRSLTSAVAYMHPSSQAHPKAVDPPLVLWSVLDVYAVELDGKAERDLSDIRLLDEIYIHTSLHAGLALICDKGVEYSVEAPKDGSGIFKLSLR